jgi:hypothetical protein
MCGITAMTFNYHPALICAEKAKIRCPKIALFGQPPLKMKHLFIKLVAYICYARFMM